MLEIIKQLALDAAEKGADFCVGTVTKAAPLTIRLEEGGVFGADGGCFAGGGNGQYTD